MRLPKYVLLGVAILVAVAATTSVAFGATRAGSFAFSVHSHRALVSNETH